MLASDPDADRVGSAVKNEAGEWVLLNGNQNAILYVYYLLTRWERDRSAHWAGVYRQNDRHVRDHPGYRRA